MVGGKSQVTALKKKLKGTEGIQSLPFFLFVAA